ncbi:MAG: sigma-54 dependent transcriptional regulator [Myxococcota bacterium]
MSSSFAMRASAAPRPVVASQAMLRVFSTLERVAASVVPVLILGETGTGKEVVARAIHDGGPRAPSPFRCVNCGGLAESLVESTLFGHERGAFTGAEERKVGVFESGQGGTVFLDEIGELPSSAQAALLRVLETKRVTRVGGVDEIPVDVRILAATHRNLVQMCEDGDFRWDLYYRLNVVSLTLPPLRERREEIPLLAERFAEEAAQANGRPSRVLSEVALARLCAHDWPGNVRELKNVVERAVVIAAGPRIDGDDLPAAILSSSSAREDFVATPASPLIAHPKDPCIQPGQLPHQPEVEAEATEDLGHHGPILDFKTQMQQAERRVLLAALERAGLNQTEAAKLLQMPLRTLVHKIKVLGLRDELARLKASRGRT